MKKLLAVILAVLLLGSATAFAETATVFTLSDPTVTANIDSEEMNIDLAGLELAIAPIMEGEVPGVAINIYGKGELLLAAAARVLGDRALLDMEGLSNTYYAAIPDVASMAGSMDLSGIDMDALTEIVMGSIELETEGDTTTFKLPYTAVNQILEAVLPVLKQVDVEGVDLDLSEVEDMLAQFKETDSGLNVKGTVKETETGASGAVQTYLVQGGQASESPVSACTVDFNQGETGITFAASLFAADEESGSLLNVVTINAEIGAAVNVNIALMEGMANISFSYDFATGLVTINVNAEGIDVTLTCTVSVGEGEITIVPAGDPSTAINLEELTEEQVEQATTELTQATAYLVGFLYPVFAQFSA